MRLREAHRRLRGVIAGLIALLAWTLAASAQAQLTAAPDYPGLAPFCPDGLTQSVGSSAQINAMQSCQPQDLFLMPRGPCAGQAPRYILIGDGPMTDYHVRIWRESNDAGVPTVVYRGAGGRPAYNLDCTNLGPSCANRQSLIVNNEAVRWFARNNPQCQVLELGNRGPGEAVPPTSLGFNWTGMERCALQQEGMRTANPTWPGMEWGARPPSTYVPFGPRPPVTTPAVTWPGMEWGAPPPSSYRPGPPPASCGGGGTTLYCGFPPPRVPNWARPSGPMNGNQLFNGGMGMGTFGPIAVAGGGMTYNGLANCANDNPEGILQATGGTLLMTSAGSVTLYSAGTFATGAGYFGAGSTLTAGGTTLATVALPATACVAVATVSYCGTRAVDNATGGRISDGLATGMCAIGDTGANLLWRWWAPGCEWNYELTSSSAGMFGQSARCNMRGPGPSQCGGSVQAGGVDPPYEGNDALPIDGGCACSTRPVEQGSHGHAWVALFLLGLGIRRRRRQHQPADKAAA